MQIEETVKAIDQTISGAKVIIEDVAPKIQKSAQGFSERMLVLAEKYPSLEEFAQKLNKAADVMHDVLYLLGVDMEPVEVIGEKISSAEKGVEEFEATEDYLQYIQNEVHVDVHSEDHMLLGEKLGHIITGLAFVIEILSEKLGVEIPVSIVEVAARIVQFNKIDMNSAQMISFINGLKEGGILDLNDICEYIQGTGESDRVKTGEVLLKVLDDLYPDQGEEILNNIMDEVRE